MGDGLSCLSACLMPPVCLSPHQHNPPRLVPQEAAARAVHAGAVQHGVRKHGFLQAGPGTTHTQSAESKPAVQQGAYGNTIRLQLITRTPDVWVCPWVCISPNQSQHQSLQQPLWSSGWLCKPCGPGRTCFRSCSNTAKATMGVDVKSTLNVAMRPLVKSGCALKPECMHAGKGMERGGGAEAGGRAAQGVNAQAVTGSASCTHGALIATSTRAPRHCASHSPM